MSSDALPGEPHIHASKNGDLIAEFAAKHGTMTAVITAAFVLLFTVVDRSTPIENRFAFDNDDPAVLRRELKRLTAMLYTGRHGSVDTTKRSSR
jgi:hypothetical protein